MGSDKREGHVCIIWTTDMKHMLLFFSKVSVFDAINLLHVYLSHAHVCHYSTGVIFDMYATACRLIASSRERADLHFSHYR